MKAPIIFVCLAIGFHVQAQDSSNRSEADQREATPFEIKERGAHHKVWERVEYKTRPDGTKVPHIRSYTELATGMHFRGSDGQWLEAREEIEILPGGVGAKAEQGQHKVIFPANVAEGLIELNTPDNKWLRSRVLGLSYYDTSSGESVMIAEIQDSVGELHGKNEVIYSAAFTDVHADVRYRYTSAGFEQDIILREQLPSPSVWQLHPESTLLEVLTEFVDAPTPVRQRRGGEAFMDEHLDFGVMKIEKGRAFELGNENDRRRSQPVLKMWEKLEGRDFLIERVPLETVKEELLKLPPRTAMKERSGESGAVRRTASKNRVLPGTRTVEKKPTQAFQIASADAGARPGYVLDYITLNSSHTNYTFKGDTTYYISGPVNLYGTNTIEGGTVVKYIPTAYSHISVPGALKCNTTRYRPAVFTSRDDNSVGETISGSTGSPTVNNQGNYQLIVEEDGIELHNLRFNYGYCNLTLVYASATLSDLQFCHNDYPIYTWNGSVMDLDIRNVLMQDVRVLAFELGNTTARAEHVTVHQSAGLWYNDFGSSMAFTNCLFVSVTNMVTSFSGANNATNSSSSGIFHSVGGGYHYLNTNSPCRNAGTTNISTEMLAILKKTTTYPPIVYSNTTISSSTNWDIQASRDSDVPDLGYHYTPLDYLVCGLVVSSNVTLTLTNGAAVGIDYTSSSWGFDLRNAKFISTGFPDQLNYVGRAHTVQELSGPNPGTRACFYDGNSSSGSRDSAVRLRFTKFSQMANDGYMLYVGTKFGALEWTHGSIYNPSLVVNVTGSGTLICGLTNSLWERGSVQFGVGGTTGAGVAVHLRNNLARNLTSWHFVNGNYTWTIHDNLFDTVGLVTNHNSYVENWTNAYYQTAWGLSGGAGNIPLTNLTYQAGPLGDYYQPASSVLIDAGTRRADEAGLYHFTTQTNQVKETNSVVDIGYHYVAVDGNGNPLDTDSDGVPDYIEDANGNGIFDAGDAGDWNPPDSDGDGVADWIEIAQGRNPNSPSLPGAVNDAANATALRVYTPLK